MDGQSWLLAVYVARPCRFGMRYMQNSAGRVLHTAWGITRSRQIGKVVKILIAWVGMQGLRLQPETSRVAVRHQMNRSCVASNSSCFMMLFLINGIKAKPTVRITKSTFLNFISALF